jgi:tetratricopeptide (TPR) repeat protein
MRNFFFPPKKFIAALLCAALPALAQNADSPFAEMRSAFQQLNYHAAKSAGERALRDWRKLSPQNVVEVHQVLGIIAYSEGSFFEAKTQFEAALSLDPGLRLDSLYVSPKIQQFLQEVKDALAAGNGHGRGDLRYLVVPDPRPKAALHSLLFPGLGQMEKGQKTKGRAMMIAAGVGVIATGALHLRREAAQKNYLSAQTIARAVSTYNRYNMFNRARNGAALLTTGVWLYSFFDALTLTPDSPQPRLSLAPSGHDAHFAPVLSWQISF